MATFNWTNYCIPCKNWCCKGENPFASEKELQEMGKDKPIGRKADGTCEFLGETGLCTAYNHRPFECRIFPLDITAKDGKLFWAIWEVCPGSKSVDAEKMMASIEKELPGKWDLEYIQSYIDFHRAKQPEKYSSEKMNVLREIKFLNIKPK